MSDTLQTGKQWFQADKEKAALKKATMADLIVPHFDSNVNVVDTDTMRKPTLVCMADVAREEVDWLWHPYIPKGKITLLEGDPSVGKTWISLQLCASITRGLRFPDQAGRINEQDITEPRNVIYLTAEDGLGDTLGPRLDKMNADSNRVFSHDVTTGAISLSDLRILEMWMIEKKPALVVIDPLQAYLGAGVDMHRANEVRPVLSGIGMLAEKYKTAILCIRHLNKGGGKALYRGMGSIDFTAHARSVILVGQDFEDPAKRAIIHIKSSLAKNGVPIGYRMDEAGGFQWTGLSDLTIDDLLGNMTIDKSGESNKLDEAGELLAAILVKPRSTNDIKAEAKKAGISWRTIERAKAELNVGAFQKWNNETGKNEWCWGFKSVGGEPATLSKAKNVGGLSERVSALDPQGIPVTTQTANSGESGKVITFRRPMHTANGGESGEPISLELQGTYPIPPDRQETCLTGREPVRLTNEVDLPLEEKEEKGNDDLWI